METISHYRVLKKLGQGGMAEVFLAEDTRLKRKVALKFLSAEFTADKGRLSRFRQEARAASSLNHPCILTVFDIEELDSAFFIATEYVEGETLRHVVPIPVKTATESGETGHPIGAKRRWRLNDVPGGWFGQSGLLRMVSAKTIYDCVGY